jgi:hypothetical protein
VVKKLNIGLPRDEIRYTNDEIRPIRY